MADGKTHAQVADGLIVAGAIVGFSLWPWPVAVLAVGGLVIGKYANPDQRDMENIRLYSAGRIHKRLGSLFGWLWTAFWWPLAWLIPHRHWASHLPGVATVIAWLYLFLPWWLLVALVAPDYTQLAVIAACWALPGWFLQDFAHLVLDKFGIKWD